MVDLKSMKAKNLKEIDKIYIEFNKAKDQNKRKYLVKRFIDICDNFIENDISPNEFIKIKNRFLNIHKYTDIYNFTLAEQLREQKVIVSDSIQSSPYHIKKLELKNTSMVQFPENKINTQ